jgi:ketosteroid isomerase-like protein
MYYRDLVAAMLLSLMLVVAPHALLADDHIEGTQATEAALGEVRKANAEFWRAFSDRDLWSMGRLWIKSESVSAIFPADAAVFVGWDNCRESFRRSFAHNRDIRIDPRVASIRAEGAVAWLVEAVRFEAVQTQTGQSIVMDRMLVTKLFVRTDGKWLLVHFHGHFPGFPIPGATQHMPLSQEPTEEQPSDDVARASTAFYAAFAKQDLESMSRAWAHDDSVSAIHPSSPAPFLGRDEVIRSWKQAFTDIESVFIRHRFAIHHILGSVAWVVDMNEFHALLAEGAAPKHLHTVLSTQIFERRESQWLMVHYHGQIGFSFGHAD